jgi:hypothetical protein
VAFVQWPVVEGLEHFALADVAYVVDDGNVTVTDTLGIQGHGTAADGLYPENISTARSTYSDVHLHSPLSGQLTDRRPERRSPPAARRTFPASVGGDVLLTARLAVHALPSLKGVVLFLSFLDPDGQVGPKGGQQGLSAAIVAVLDSFQLLVDHAEFGNMVSQDFIHVHSPFA